MEIYSLNILLNDPYFIKWYNNKKSDATKRSIQSSSVIYENHYQQKISLENRDVIKDKDKTLNISNSDSLGKENDKEEKRLFSNEFQIFISKVILFLIVLILNYYFYLD